VWHKPVTLSTTQKPSPKLRYYSWARNTIILPEHMMSSTHAVPGLATSSSFPSPRCGHLHDILEPTTPSNPHHPWAHNAVILHEPETLHCIFFVILSLQILILICYIATLLWYATLLLFCCIALICYIAFNMLHSFDMLHCHIAFDMLHCHIALICYIAFVLLHCFDMLHCQIALICYILLHCFCSTTF
jgi:hypothetical protein